jgi:hypothetical protein
METTFCEINDPADDEIAKRAELAAPQSLEARAPFALPCISFPDRCAFLESRLNTLCRDSALN